MATNYSVSAFWREKLVLWFMQTEAMFEKHKVTDDTAKFNTVVGALDVSTIDDLQDVIRNPPANNTKCATLKGTIIKRTTESPDNNLLKMLTNLELGDSKPSQHWRKMKSLADRKILEPALKVMWLAHLPAPAQTYLSVFKIENVEDLLEATNKIITRNKQVTAVTAIGDTSNASSGYGTPVSAIAPEQQQLAAIQTAIAQLSVLTSHSRGRRDRGKQTMARDTREAELAATPARGDARQQAAKTTAETPTHTTYIGHSISTYGTQRLKLSLGLRRNFTCNVIIADVPHTILGANFLIQHGLVVDVKSRSIRNKGALASRYDALLEEFADVFDNAICPTCTLGLLVKHVINTNGPL
ncbi:hypothetical protein TSAR_009225, partial [Trichomalopsis sarcophagae]